MLGSVKMRSENCVVSFANKSYNMCSIVSEVMKGVYAASLMSAREFNFEKIVFYNNNNNNDTHSQQFLYFFSTERLVPNVRNAVVA